MTDIQSLIAKRVDPMFHHLIGPDAELERDLRIPRVQFAALLFDIEMDRSVMFAGEPDEAWETVADVIASVEQLRKAAA
jgi:hypothetical protein